MYLCMVLNVQSGKKNVCVNVDGPDITTGEVDSTIIPWCTVL